VNDHSLCNPLPCMPVLTPALRLPSHSQVLVHEILSVHASAHPSASPSFPFTGARA
jgi:hypothetical protein